MSTNPPGVDQSANRAPAHVARVAQFYAIARSAHLERSIELGNWLFYVRPNYDFDENIARTHPRLRRVSAWKVLAAARAAGVTTLEINEPLMLPAWKHLIPLLLAASVTRQRPRIVFYAIENWSPVGRLSRVTRFPAPLSDLVVKLVTRWTFRHSARVAFGTSASRDLYSRWIDLNAPRPETRIISARPKAATMCPAKIPSSVVYLGELSPRKGIDRVLDAWPQIQSMLPGAHLSVLGVGELREQVEALAGSTESVELIHDPSREEIRDVLERSEVLILLSRTSPTWREQIGLPIVEGWSHGCKIVCTDGTGIARELTEAGHTVLSEACAIDDVARAVVDAIRSPITAEAILAALPSKDGRVEAAEWLWSERE